MNRVPRWRIVAGIAVLAVLGLFAAVFTPIYFHNLELQEYVSSLAQSPAAGQSDTALESSVLAKAGQLRLPVQPDNIHIVRTAATPNTPAACHIDVRYEVTVTLPGYTVNLHFYPGAGSR